MMMKRLLLVATIAFCVTACAATERKSSMTTDAAKLTAGTEQGDFDKLLVDADSAWAQRVSKEQTLNAINLWEKAAKTKSPNLDEAARKAKLGEVFTNLSRAYYLLADSHLRLEAEDDELNDAMMKQFEHGVTAAEKAIAIYDPKFTAAVSADSNNWKSAVGSADKAALPALYWYSTNLGKWALLEGIATILSRKDDIKATLDWCLKTDPTYFHGAFYRYFGAYHTKVPLGGGAPDKSKAAFEKSIEVAPGYLATKVLMASNYAVLIGDRDLFEKLLKEVVAADPNALAEVAPENKLEQQKAKGLLKLTDDFFY